jgi:peptide/nickel transport system permease protein
VSARPALRLLGSSRRALAGLVVLGALALAAIFAEWIAADAPIAARSPDRAWILPAIVEADAIDAMSRSELDARFDAAPAIWPLVRSGPTRPSPAGPHAPPSRAHPLGTDAEGRDLAARLVYGARTALGVSLFAVALSVALGVGLGALAGYLRGAWNDWLVRLVETVDSFPAIVVVALVRAIEHRPSAASLIVAVACVRWAEVARLTRAEVLRASAEDYVAAARALGASPLHVLARHVLPSALGPVLASSIFGVASVVLLEASVSFLGLGGATDAASWGETLAEGARDPSRLALVLLPGLLLLLTIGGTHLVADALRDALDPRAVRGSVEGRDR